MKALILALLLGSQIFGSVSLKGSENKKGEDNNRSAFIRFTYSLNAKSFSIRKEVRYEDENQFFERNGFDWKR